MMAAFARDRWMPEEQTIAKARSSRCTEAFDLHIYPVGGRVAATPTGWRWTLEVACLTPRSRGALKLASADPAGQPIIDHRYLSDPEDEDLRVLTRRDRARPRDRRETRTVATGGRRALTRQRHRDPR